MIGSRKNSLLRLVRGITLTVFSAACLGAAAFAVDGTVTASALRIREETSTGAEVMGTVRGGDRLEINGRLGDWYLVNYNGNAGFVFAEYVQPVGDIAISPSMGTITGASVNVRAKPGTDSDIRTKLIKGTAVNVTAVENGWYAVKYLDVTGYVHPDYLEVSGVSVKPIKTEAPDSDLPADAEEVRPDAVHTYTDSAVSGKRQELLDFANRHLGIQYKHAGTSPSTGFDCSGFTYYVFKNFGITLNRSSSAQYKNGTSVSKSQLIPGDLVFFSRGSVSIGHVGIYIGNGNFIHSSSPGDVVKITSLDSNYYSARYVGARRILD